MHILYSFVLILSTFLKQHISLNPFISKTSTLAFLSIHLCFTPIYYNSKQILSNILTYLSFIIFSLLSHLLWYPNTYILPITIFYFPFTSTNFPLPCLLFLKHPTSLLKILLIFYPFFPLLTTNPLCTPPHLPHFPLPLSTSPSCSPFFSSHLPSFPYFPHPTENFYSSNIDTIMQ